MVNGQDLLWKDVLLIAAPIATAVGTVVLATLTFLSIKRLGMQDEREQISNILDKVVSPFIGQVYNQITYLKSEMYEPYSVTDQPIRDLLPIDKLLYEDFLDRHPKVSNLIRVHSNECHNFLQCLKELEDVIYGDKQFFQTVRENKDEETSRMILRWVMKGSRMPSPEPSITNKLNIVEWENLRNGKGEYKKVKICNKRLIEVSEQLISRLVTIRKKLRKKYKIP